MLEYAADLVDNATAIRFVAFVNGRLPANSAASEATTVTFNQPAFDVLAEQNRETEFRVAAHRDCTGGTLWYEDVVQFNVCRID